MTKTYDREGRLSTVVCNGTTTTRSYDLANDVLSESESGGILNGLAVDCTYDSLLRRTNMAVLNGATILTQTTNSYDGAGRISVVSDGTNTATYTYLANSRLVDHIVFANSGAGVMTTRYTNDYMNRLTGISSVLNYAYGYNTASQRTSITNGDGTIWDYQYDSLGQVTNGIKHWGNGNVVAGQQFGYGFDSVGNRAMTLGGGDSSGANQRLSGYTVNSLNQVSSRDYPGDADIMGLAVATNTVAVNGTNAYRKWEYFREQMATNNGSAAQWMGINVTAPGQTTLSGHLFIPQTPESFTYDADGNLTQDGRWTYTWDGENRLINMTSLSGGPTGSLLELDFTYDAFGRRIQKVVSTNLSGTYSPAYTNRYVYDGGNVVAMLDQNDAILATFMWGLDLSGTHGGAGGVGGLLAENLGANGVHFAAYDAMGNVAGLVSASGGTRSALYEYDPFGNELRISGTVSKSNPIRFSSKFADDESDYLYYQYRYYKPSVGGWLSPDPIGENGGKNLYDFVGNNVANAVDIYGLEAGYTYNSDGSMTPPSLYGPDSLWNLFRQAWQSYNNWTKRNRNALRKYSPGLAGEIDDIDQSGAMGMVMPEAPEGGLGQTGEGEFSIFNWNGYPEDLPKPQGSCRILTGKEYEDARNAANKANAAMHKANDSLNGMQIHEIKPVKFGGDPTDPANKIPLTPAQHIEVNRWWNNFLQYLRNIQDYWNNQ